MNIILTQEDADFILKYIRMDARRVDERCEELKKNELNLLESCKQLNKFEPKTAFVISNFAKEFGKNAIYELEEIKSDFTRCIKLLTIGSEVTE